MRYQQGSGSVNDLSKELAQVRHHTMSTSAITVMCLKLTEELETVKAQMDERGTSMTDSGWPFLLLQTLHAPLTPMELA